MRTGWSACPRPPPAQRRGSDLDRVMRHTTTITPRLDVKSGRPATTLTWPMVAIAGLMAVGLLAVSGAYGFHGDEMYYIVAGQHPAFGYVRGAAQDPIRSSADGPYVPGS